MTKHISPLLATASLGILLVACGSSDSNSTGPNGPGGAPDGSAPPVTECLGQSLPERARDLSVSSASSLEPYFPTTEFRTATATEAGFDQQKFDAALAFTTPQSRTQALMVLRHGYVVTEQYTAGFTATSRHESYSMAKSFSSALVGIAINAKLLTGVDQRLCEFYGSYPGWDCSNTSDSRTRITIAHAMNVMTGLEWHEDWRSNAPPGSNDAVTGTISGNMLDYVLGKPVVDEPGTVNRYSTGDPALLSGVIQGATGKTALEYAREVLLNPIGIPDLRWNSDSKGRTTTYAGIQGTLREFAKFGFLYLRRGKWDGVQIVPEQWIDFTTQATDRCNERYRYLWHINAPMRLAENDPNCPDFPDCPPTKIANLPGNAFFAEGVTGQFIFVVPSADIVVARLASDANGSDYWDEYARGFLERLLDAVAN